MKFGVIVFPGSNCDHDCYHVIKHVLKQDVEFIWHKEDRLVSVDCLILPGGFSYGDYLRPGSIAKFSPIMKEIKRFAYEGGLVLGICNGFQILLEANLLPGAMMTNRSLRFICESVYLRLENDETPFTSRGKVGDVLKMPIAHFDGNYYADEKTLQELEDNHQIVFRYCTKDGDVTDEANPNGALGNISGICNRERNVLGMMPHPERCSESILGNEDGRLIFESIAKKELNYS
ncbi:MAG: phosphoribosylformylglycinamidine synthase subunit PurQ [Pseudomonadota bacterium]